MVCAGSGKRRGRRGQYRDRLNRRRDLLELNYDALLLRAAYSDIANRIDQRWWFSDELVRSWVNISKAKVALLVAVDRANCTSSGVD